MLTAEEAFYATREQRLVDMPEDTEDEDINEACKWICKYVNEGWLGVNLASKMSDSIKVRNYLKDLGYLVDEEFGVYWLYTPKVQKKALKAKEEPKPSIKSRRFR